MSLLLLSVLWGSAKQLEAIPVGLSAAHGLMLAGQRPGGRREVDRHGALQAAFRTVPHEDRKVIDVRPFSQGCTPGRLDLAQLEVSHQRIAQVFRAPTRLHAVSRWPHCRPDAPPRSLPVAVRIQL
jgi:hypothetical protein